VSGFYTNLRDKTVFNLLTRYGEAFRITRSANTTFDPQTGGVTASTETQDVIGKAFSRGDTFDRGEMVETEDTEIYLAAKGVTFTPLPGMAIKTPTTASTGLQIVQVFPIPKSGTVVMYRILAKK
jgi:hypothetical protein